MKKTPVTESLAQATHRHDQKNSHVCACMIHNLIDNVKHVHDCIDVCACMIHNVVYIMMHLILCMQSDLFLLQPPCGQLRTMGHGQWLLAVSGAIENTKAENNAGGVI